MKAMWGPQVDSRIEVAEAMIEAFGQRLESDISQR